MSTQTSMWLGRVNWSEFERTLFGLCQRAVQNYRELYADDPSAKVFQIAIWTDCEARQSAVSFETRRHAQEFVGTWSRQYRDRGWIEQAASLEKGGYTTNPANFEYAGYLRTPNPELDVLGSLELSDEEVRRTVDNTIANALLRVLDSLIESGVIDELPRERTVWVGVSSADDWYDHVRTV